MSITYFGDNPTNAKRALQCYLVLIGAAKRRETLTYKEIAGILGYGDGHRTGAGVMSNKLVPLMHWCDRNGLPALTSLVVNDTSGVPGDGLISVSDLPAAQQAVYKFDWYAIMPPPQDELERYV